jgi:2'-5' RNA ligase
MSELVALDVAILPPAEVSAKAVALSASLPENESKGLRLDDEHLPHITLMQMFARVNELDQVFGHIEDVLRSQGPFEVRVTGAGQGTSSVWLAVAATPLLMKLHEELMEALRGFERPDGGTAAFFDADARLRDALWVAGYRLKSSFHHFAPHITLGHGTRPPAIDPFAFVADAVAACHLGRFCTCRHVFRRWTLTAAAGASPGLPRP